MARRRARVHHRLTARGWAAISAALAAFGAGVLFGIADLVRLGVLLAAACLLLFAWQWRPFPRPVVSRILPRAGLFATVPATIVLHASHLPAHPRAFALGERIAPALGFSIDVPMAELSIHSGNAAASYQVLPERRGAGALGPTVVGRTDPLGLTRAWRYAADSQPIVIWPRLYPIAQLLALGPGSGSSARQRSHRSEEDVIPRDYRAGDDYRRIHWPATARAGRLMVRSDERSLTAAGTLHLALAAAGDDAEAEDIVSAAASVGVALLAEGHLVAISVDDGAGSFTQWQPADRSLMLDYLACLRLPTKTKTTAALPAVGDMLVLLAPASDQEALASLQAAGTSRRRIAVIVGAGAADAARELRADGVTALAWSDVTGEAPSSKTAGTRLPRRPRTRPGSATTRLGRATTRGDRPDRPAAEALR